MPSSIRSIGSVAMEVRSGLLPASFPWLVRVFLFPFLAEEAARPQFTEPGCCVTPCGLIVLEATSPCCLPLIPIFNPEECWANGSLSKTYKSLKRAMNIQSILWRTNPSESKSTVF